MFGRWNVLWKNGPFSVDILIFCLGGIYEKTCSETNKKLLQSLLIHMSLSDTTSMFSALVFCCFAGKEFQENLCHTANCRLQVAQSLASQVLKYNYRIETIITNYNWIQLVTLGFRIGFIIWFESHCTTCMLVLYFVLLMIRQQLGFAYGDCVHIWMIVCM